MPGVFDTRNGFSHLKSRGVLSLLVLFFRDPTAERLSRYFHRKKMPETRKGGPKVVIPCQSWIGHPPGAEQGGGKLPQRIPRSRGGNGATEAHKDVKKREVSSVTAKPVIRESSRSTTFVRRRVHLQRQNAPHCVLACIPAVRVTRPVPRLDELPLTEPENGPAPFAPDTQQQAAQAFAETSHADINSPGDPDDISKTKRALQGDAGTPLLPAEPSSASEVGEDARAPALAPMGPEPPAEMESYEGEVVDAPVGAGEEEEWGEGLVEGGEDVGDDGAGDGDDGLARAREEVRERAEALLSIVVSADLH